MRNFDILEIGSIEDQNLAYSIRQVVFCDEQNVDPEVEFDGLDDVCRQYLVRCDGVAIGTARIRDVGIGEVKIERVAVLKGKRGTGIGKALMTRIIDDARVTGANTISIHAQCHAEAFYETLGFRRIGNEFQEANIAHVRMELDGRL